MQVNIDEAVSHLMLFPDLVEEGFSHRPVTLALAASNSLRILTSSEVYAEAYTLTSPDYLNA